jgi:membrane-associated phospholipid phosphatase
MSRSRLNRRTLLRLGAAATAALGAAALPVTGLAAPVGSQDMIEPGAGAWKTWFLPGGSHLRLPAPPDGAGEIGQVRALASQRDGVHGRVSYWDAGAPPYRWNELAFDSLIATPDPKQGRVLAYLNAAMHDATVAAWDSKYAHRRPRPTELDPSLAGDTAVPRSPSYPSEHAVVAGAASEVLAYFFPREADAYRAMAEEAARSRVVAGVHYPSDSAAGLDLGRRVAAFAIERAKNDGADARWDGVVPTGPGKWRGTNPGGAADPKMKPFLLASGDQLRPGPPPAHDSEQFARELAEVKGFARTPRTTGYALSVQYGWSGAPGNTERMIRHVSRRVFEEGLEDSPWAARSYALVTATAFDAWLASQDAKFTYWQQRPSQADPTITTIFPTPNHPSYPSNRSVLHAAPALVLGYLFPRDAEGFWKEAEQAGESAIWSGVHFRSDVEAAREMGRALARIAIDWDSK